MFTNLLLADEINRTPPKTQSALLEAMEEGQVIGRRRDRGRCRGRSWSRRRRTRSSTRAPTRCPRPSSTGSCSRSCCRCPTATRSSRSCAGTRPASTRATSPPPGSRAVAGAADIAAGPARRARASRSSPEVAGYVVDVARATRQSPSLSLGVSPRGATALLRTARAWAWLSGRDFVTPDDVKALAQATLAHRLALRPEAELEGVDVGAVLASALGSVAGPALTPRRPMAITGRVPLLLLLGAAWRCVLRPARRHGVARGCSVGALLVGARPAARAARPASLAVERLPVGPGPRSATPTGQHARASATPGTRRVRAPACATPGSRRPGRRGNRHRARPAPGRPRRC